MSKPIDLNSLYKLFFSKGISEISIDAPMTPPSKTSTIFQMFTPMSKIIYESVSPASQTRLIKEFQQNNIELANIEKKEEKLDPDYQEKMSNNGLGFYMEDFVSNYCMCPVCGQFMLRKYTHSNVPVVDIICTNSKYHLEKNECFIFQIKTSLSEYYFSEKNHSIVVGSKKYGEPAHIHTGSEDITTKIVMPGYFCIKLNRSIDQSQSYTIDSKNSFIIIPDYHNKTNDFYYQYTGKTNRFKKDIIQWNPLMFIRKKLSDITLVTNIEYEVFREDELKNPYSNLIGSLKN